MFYLINKEKGISSFRAIKQFAREMNIKKIGHTGTLDPLATGALLVATNSDTRLIEYVKDTNKTYEATMRFGYISDTYDIDGDVKKICDAKIDIKVFTEKLMSFMGKSLQKPPAYSAKKINGVRAYDLARKNFEVNLKKINIEVLSISSIEKLSDADFKFTIEVTRGTYIRSIIHDLGEKMNCGAVMTDLIRTKIGTLELKEKYYAVDVKKILNLPIIKIDDFADTFNGKSIKLSSKDGKYAIECNNKIIAIGSITDNIFKPSKVFREA